MSYFSQVFEARFQLVSILDFPKQTIITTLQSTTREKKKSTIASIWRENILGLICPRALLVPQSKPFSESLLEQDMSTDKYPNVFSYFRNTRSLKIVEYYQSGTVISFDNLDQNKSLTNRCTSFRSRDIIW